MTYDNHSTLAVCIAPLVHFSDFRKLAKSEMIAIVSQEKDQRWNPENNEINPNRSAFSQKHLKRQDIQNET